MAFQLGDNVETQTNGLCRGLLTPSQLPSSRAKRSNDDLEEPSNDLVGKDPIESQGSGKRISRFYVRWNHSFECLMAQGDYFAHVKLPKTCSVIVLVIFLYILCIGQVLYSDPDMWKTRRSNRKDKLWFAPFFHKELNAIALSEFRHRLSTVSLDDAREVCPVILSAAIRPEPHWAWLTATLLRSHGFGYNSNVQFPSRIPILVRPGGGLAQSNSRVFNEHFVRSLIDANVIEVIEESHNTTMPPDATFDRPLIGASTSQSKHFVLQLLDHAKAWDVCRARKCSFCLVLEDDAVIARRWSRRLKQALSIHNNEDADWGILKLFETNDAFTMSDKGHADLHVYNIMTFAVVGSGPLVYLWYYWSEARPTRPALLGGWCFIIAWLAIAFYVIEKEYDLSSTNNRMTRYTSITQTRVRDAVIPLRGAVANVYKHEDLSELIEHTHKTISETLNRLPSKSGKTMTDERFYKEHSDRIRVDVLVGEFFLKKKKRSIKVVEPNLVQHIGFRSSEPDFDGLRIALTSTFEDGRIF